MGSQGFFMAAAPSHPSQYPAAIPSSSSTSPSLLSAMAAPFIPTQVQEHHALHPVMMQNPFLHHHPMMYQTPYQMPPGYMDAPMYYSTMPHPHPGKHLNASSIKKHNRAQSQQKERMYQEWMLAQHQPASPPVSVSGKPSIVMPESDYIGYYFKPKSEYVGYYMKDKATETEMDSTPQMSKEETVTHEGKARQLSQDTVAAHQGLAQQRSKEKIAAPEGPTQQISEGLTAPDGQAQHMPKKHTATPEGPTPQSSQDKVASLNPQAQQTPNDQLPTREAPPPPPSQNPPTAPKAPPHTATQELILSPGNDIDYRLSRQGLTAFLPLLPLHRPTKLAADHHGPTPNGGFLPLLEPAPKPASKPAFADRDCEVTSCPPDRDGAEHKHQGGGNEYGGYSYATVRGRKA